MCLDSSAFVLSLLRCVLDLYCIIVNMPSSVVKTGFGLVIQKLSSHVDFIDKSVET